MADDDSPGWVAPGSAPPPPQQQPPSAPPGYVPPAYAPPPGTPYHYPYPQQFRPAHKPGIVPLRPLGLGDLYDGALHAIRRNPKPMVGLAVLVMTSVLLLPAVVTVLLALTGDMTMASLDGTETSDGIDPATIALLAGTLLSSLAGIVLTGMIVRVVADAVLGRKASVDDAWRAVRGRMLRLVGLAIVSGLVIAIPIVVVVLVVVAAYLISLPLGILATVLGVLGSIAYVAWAQVRLILLAAPALVLEKRGIFASMNRSMDLTRGQFWRMLGISLLTTLVTAVVGQILALPFSVGGAVGTLFIDNRTTAALVYVFSSYIALIVSAAVTTPFSSAVHALMYVDQRIRKEAYDVELIAQASSQGQSAPVP